MRSFFEIIKEAHDLGLTADDKIYGADSKLLLTLSNECVAKCAEMMGLPDSLLNTLKEEDVQN